MLVLRIVGYLGNHHWTSYLKCKLLGLILGFLIQEVRGFMKNPPGCCLGSPHSYYRSTTPSLEYHSDYPQMNVLSGSRGSLRYHLPCTFQPFQLWCLNHSHRWCPDPVLQRSLRHGWATIPPVLTLHVVGFVCTLHDSFGC